jgi:hypothetical protein
MGSNHTANPVKLFIVVLNVKDVRLEERLEERFISNYGASDHRMILIPSDRTIHRVFLSFDRLIETGNLPKIRELSQSMEKEFSATVVMGYVDNRRVAVAETAGTGAYENVMEFKDGGIQHLSRKHPDYLSDESHEFFLSMRKTYRAQLRSMCLLENRAVLQYSP